MKLNRPLAVWRGMLPSKVADGSKAHCFYAIEDAHHDLLAIADASQALLRALKQMSGGQTSILIDERAKELRELLK